MANILWTLGPLLDEIQHRFPIVGESEIRQMINGPESFTPDGYPILGEAPNVCLIIVYIKGCFYCVDHV